MPLMGQRIHEGLRIKWVTLGSTHGSLVTQLTGSRGSEVSSAGFPGDFGQGTETIVWVRKLSVYKGAGPDYIGREHDIGLWMRKFS